MKYWATYRGHLRAATVPVAFVVTLHSAACNPVTGNTVVENVRPDPSSRPVTEIRKKDGEVQARAWTDGNTVRVHAERTILCSERTNQSMISDTKTERSLQPEVRTGQWVLGATVILGELLGVVALASKCNTSETDQSGQKVTRPCTSGESADQRNLGLGSIGIGIAAGGLFAANAIRASDSHERGLPAEPRITETEWSKCDNGNAAEYKVLLKFEGGTLETVTDADGLASFDFAELTMPSTIDRNSKADIVIRNIRVGQVDLAKLAIFPEWEARLERKREVAQAAAKLEEAKQEAAQKLEEAARKEEESARRKQIAKWHTVTPDAVMQLMHHYTEAFDHKNGQVDYENLFFRYGENAGRQMVQESLEVMGVVAACLTPSRECVESALKQFPDDLVVVDGEIRVSPKLEESGRLVAESNRKLRPKRHAECVRSCLRDSKISITRDQCEAKCD